MKNLVKELKVEQFTFAIALSVLNHLGRKLYRSPITIIAEAISNAWDADAKNVWIYLARDKMMIKDDGIGMDASDFKSKFLKIGYSKRGEDGSFSESPQKRPYIGRKGIGKLALLSSAERISVITRKTSADPYVGAMIDNKKLEKDIKDDRTAAESVLGRVNMVPFIQYTRKHKNGTLILLDKLYKELNYKPETIKRLIAYYFKFSLIDKGFNIYVNDKLVTERDLKELREKTQFVWVLNSHEESYLNKGSKFKYLKNVKLGNKNLHGYLATTEKTRDLNVMGLGDVVDPIHCTRSLCSFMVANRFAFAN